MVLALSLIASARGSCATILWLIAAILVIAGILTIVRGGVLAGVAGLVFAWKRQRAAFWILGSIWLAYPLVYYLVNFTNPYRYPMHWSVLLLAAYGFISSVEALARPSQRDVSSVPDRRGQSSGV